METEVKGLTREEVLAMKAGRELDALCCERVFGYAHLTGDMVPDDHKHHNLDDGQQQEVWVKDLGDGMVDRYCKYCGDLPCYSTDMTAAWEIVKHVQTERPYWRFSILGGDEGFGSQWKAEWFGEADPDKDYGDRHGIARCATAPEAICKAALLAKLGL
jgi:hypothetical protein